MCRLQSLLDSIEKQEEENEDKIKQKNETLPPKTKRVGKMKFEAKSLDFVFTDELPSSLRKMKVFLIFLFMFCD